MYTEKQRTDALFKLFEAYVDFTARGLVTIEELLKQLNIELVECDLPLLRAYANFGRGGYYYKIEVSKLAGSDVRTCMVFHELAELLLLSIVGIKLYDEDKASEYWEKEYWCDSFALAMVLARYNYRAMNNSNYRKFLLEGSENPPGREVSDRFFGERLLHIAKETGLKEIRILGEIFLAEANKTPG